MQDALSGLQWVGENFGFGALVSVILLSWGIIILRDLSKKIEENTLATLHSVLAMAFAPKVIQDQAIDLKDRIESRKERRTK